MNKQLYVQVIQTTWLLFEWLSRVGHEEWSGRKETDGSYSQMLFSMGGNCLSMLGEHESHDGNKDE